MMVNGVDKVIVKNKETIARIEKQDEAETIVRSRTVRLRPTKKQEGMLRFLCDLAAKLWNQLNYIRRQDFFAEQFDWKHGTKALYDEFSPILGSSYTQQVMRKNTFAWRSFFQLLKRAKQGQLPPHMQAWKLSPPGYWKNNDGSRKKILLVRSDQYRFDEQARKLLIPGNQSLVASSQLPPRTKLSIRYSGFLLSEGKQGELEILFDGQRKRWYAHQPRILPRPRPPETDRSEKAAYVDLGARRLFAAVDDDNQTYLAAAGIILSDWRYWTKKIAHEQRRLKKVHKQDWSKKLQKLYTKRTERHRYFMNCIIKSFLTELANRGVAKLYLGDVRGIRQNSKKSSTRQKPSKKTNQLNNNYWNFGSILRRFQLTAENFGMTLELVNERWTSKTCALCGVRHRGGRVKRGLYYCKKYKKYFQADINAAVNIRKVALGLPVSSADKGSWLMGQPVRIRLPKRLAPKVF